MLVAAQILALREANRLSFGHGFKRGFIQSTLGHTKVSSDFARGLGPTKSKTVHQNLSRFAPRLKAGYAYTGPTMPPVFRWAPGSRSKSHV